MDVVAYMTEHGHEELVVCHDRESGLRGLIAVHNTTLGPGLGGIRLWHYDDSDAAILDVLRLSEGMTYKAAVAGLAQGGGKAVIMADGKESDPAVRAARFRALGRFVNDLGGCYIAAEDVGTKPADVVELSKETRHVTGLPIERGGSGDPSPMTAFGVYSGIKALVEEVLKTDSLAGVRVALQGVGKVGMALATYLVDAGAEVTATDIRADVLQEAANSLKIKTVAPDEIYDVECDIFSPNALGAIINDETLPRLNCKIIAGSANNQLHDPEKHGIALQERDIVYGVDYVLNAGGIINISVEVEDGGYSEMKARARTGEIYYTVKRMLTLANEQGITTERAAMQMALDALNNPHPEPA